jgi:hypothetical protein
MQVEIADEQGLDETYVFNHQMHGTVSGHRLTVNQGSPRPLQRNTATTAVCVEL